jgi:hypothetical protein
MRSICVGRRHAGRSGAAIALLLLLGLPGQAVAVETNVHGLLDLVTTGNSEAIPLNIFNRGDTPFDAYRLRLFVEGAVTDRVQVYTQILFADAASARALGAYVMGDPWEGLDLHFIVGEIPWIIGTFSGRSYSDKNPLVGLPMMYQYHTTLRSDQVIAGPDAILAVAGSGNAGVNYVSGGRPFRGMTVAYDQCWDYGVAFQGSARPMEFAVGFVNGVPGHPNAARDENGGKTVLGRAGFVPTAGARIGISGAYGPYLSDDFAGSLPTGRRAEDYHQVLAMADCEWSIAHLTLRGEGYSNAWETPRLGDLRVSGFYVEGKYTLPAGFYLAGRHEIMRFGDLADSTGTARPWDADWNRSEVGAGYRIARGALAKIVYQTNLERTAPGKESERYDLVAGQLSIRF